MPAVAIVELCPADSSVSYESGTGRFLCFHISSILSRRSMSSLKICSLVRTTKIEASRKSHLVKDALGGPWLAQSRPDLLESGRFLPEIFNLTGCDPESRKSRGQTESSRTVLAIHNGLVKLSGVRLVVHSKELSVFAHVRMSMVIRVET
jgi:hypothetical protein